jgi:hypothetical protein
MSGSHEDDRDRNRCRGHHDDWNDRGMGMSAFDSPEEESRVLDAALRDHENTEINQILGWNMRHTETGSGDLDEILGLCRKKQEQEKTDMEQKENGKTEEIGSPRMSHEMKEIFMLANKAIDLMTDLFAGLDDESKEVMRKMISKGSGPVDTEGESFMAVYGKVKSLLVHIRRETSGGRLVQTFDIWKEGFEDEDGREQAELLAKGVPGSDFHDAVKFWYESTINAEHIYGPLSVKGSGKSAKMWLWGCRLYDNEQDARKRFG